jgi:hypothetical protein
MLYIYPCCRRQHEKKTEWNPRYPKVNINIQISSEEIKWGIWGGASRIPR